MTYEDVKMHLDRRPFVPFTVQTDDGELIGVRSAEFAYLPPKRRYLLISSDGTAPVVDRFIDLDHISQLITEDGFDVARRTA